MKKGIGHRFPRFQTDHHDQDSDSHDCQPCPWLSNVDWDLLYNHSDTPGEQIWIGISDDLGNTRWDLDNQLPKISPTKFSHNLFGVDCP
jgi:hypothetical protein